MEDSAAALAACVFAQMHRALCDAASKVRVDELLLPAIQMQLSKQVIAALVSQHAPKSAYEQCPSLWDAYVVGVILIEYVHLTLACNKACHLILSL